MLSNRASGFYTFIVIACLLGGGGVPNALPNLVVQLFAIGLLAANFDSVQAFFFKAPRTLAALVLLSVALPLLQLVPLPPSVWGTLPGRELVKESLEASGHVGWFAISVNSARTFVAFLGLLAPLTIILIGWQCSPPNLSRGASAFIAMGLLGVGLGSIQLLTNGNTGILYKGPEMPGVLFGFFANRNSTAIFFDCCLLLLVTQPLGRSISADIFGKAVASALLATGAILTQSRTGIVLLSLPLLVAAIRMFGHWFSKRGRQDRARLSIIRIVLPAVFGLIIIGAVTAPLVGGSRLEVSLARFEKAQEQRPAIWDDARFTAQRYWPVGAGMATFDEVFQVDESLEYVSPRRAGRAHNDYLEFAIEAGLPGLFLLASWAVWVLVALRRSWDSPAIWQALGGAAILLTIALQSALDYPLRTEPMMCLAAFAIILLAKAKNSAGNTMEPRTQEA